MSRIILTCISVFLVILTFTCIACTQSPAGSREGSQRVAEEFVRLETTFRFDGIPETLEVTSTTSVGNGWKYTIEFDSRHAGYGNRSGQALAEVITHHVAEVTVQAGLVTTAIMDEKWDMIQQQVIGEAPPPSGVPAAPNDSLVTAIVIDVIRLEGEMSWEIVVEIQSSEDIPGFNNATKARVGETITVITDEDASNLEKGQVITAHARLVGDERSHFFEASDIK